MNIIFSCDFFSPENSSFDLCFNLMILSKEEPDGGSVTQVASVRR